MKYKVAIIGGGPAGLMAGIRAGELTDRVVVIEKNKQPGIKLLLTGGGRCNITNMIEDPKEFSASLGQAGKFLISGLTKFGVSEVLDFFNGCGVKTKIEKNNQIFPESNNAGEVLDALLKQLKKNRVEILTQAEVKKIIVDSNKITKVVLTDGQEVLADNFILATGGKSYPQTGSTGDSFKWLNQLGHTVVRPRPALTPLIVKENFIKRLEGLSLEQIKLSLLIANKKVNHVFGDLIFTASGLSGPAVLNLSRFLKGEVLKNINLEIDFFPEIDPVQLDKQLQLIFSQNGNKQLKNCLSDLIRPKLIPVLCELAGINPELKVNAITRAQRELLVKLLKNFSLTLKATGDFGQAMITAGGVALNEIDPKTMRSKKISNLFIIGEALDLDGPTGGFNLQICWTTGYVAGQSAAVN